jgi:hypothetical protein
MLDASVDIGAVGPSLRSEDLQLTASLKEALIPQAAR